MSIETYVGSVDCPVPRSDLTARPLIPKVKAQQALTCCFASVCSVSSAEQSLVSNYSTRHVTLLNSLNLRDFGLVV